MTPNRDTPNWMQMLAYHFQRTHAEHPEDELIILFDVDGTIVDLRYMVLGLLRGYDHEHGTVYFRDICLEDIDVNENQIETLLGRMAHLDSAVRSDVARWYRTRYWDQALMFESHRPFAGVMEVMRWSDIQPGTRVGINTARPEYMRNDTLHSLNELGTEFKIEFRDELLYMSPHPWEQGVESAKCEGVQATSPRVPRGGNPVSSRLHGAADTRDA